MIASSMITLPAVRAVMSNDCKIGTPEDSKVESVRTSIAHGKEKRQGRFAGHRSDWKKAYVRLREGQKMPEFLEGA